jgi:Glyoxalase-like domain
VAEPQSRVRLRQAVLVAAELEPVSSALQSALDLGEPFRDPGVGYFGLNNAVFALGDCFLEVVSPAQPDTAAGRYLRRHGGDGGYMVIFDLEDLEAARARAQAARIRVAWQIDLPDISTTHLHPADMSGAIVSMDRSVPYGTWRWGGPQWTERIGTGAPGRLAGVTVAVGDPAAVAARWAQVLGVAVHGGDQPALGLDGAEVRFQSAEDEREEGLVEIAIEHSPRLDAAGGAIELCGVTLRALAEA